MPNQKGGKNYKKAKNTSTTDKSAFIEKEDDQMYGRIIKNLGNRNMLIYCNDNISRICRIRGALIKRIWLNVGDIILISIRDFEGKDEKEDERGDIILKFEEHHYSKLKKLDDINQLLFTQMHMEEKDKDKKVEEGFEFEYIDKKEDDEEEVDIDAI